MPAKTSLKASEYKLYETSNDQVLQSVPTVKVNEAKDLDGLNEIINEIGDDRNNITVADKVVLVI